LITAKTVPYKRFRLSVLALAMVLILVSTLPLVDSASGNMPAYNPSPNSLQRIVIASDYDARAIDGPSKTILLEVNIPGLTSPFRIRVKLQGSDAYIAVAAVAHGVLDTARGKWVALGASYAQELKNYDGIFCDKNVVIIYINKYTSRIYKGSYTIIKAVYEVRGYFEKKGPLCPDKVIPFKVIAIAEGEARDVLKRNTN